MSRKMGRPKHGEATLSRERILDAALDLIDRDGVAQFSMRRLAAELHTDPMAIYHHLPGKQAVLNGVIERLFSRFAVPLDDQTAWQDQLRQFAAAYLELTRAHADLIFFLAADAEAAAQAALPANELLYGILSRAGLAAADIVHAADVLIDYLHGVALAQRSGRLGTPNEREKLLTLLSQQPDEAFPVFRRVFAQMPVANASAGLPDGLEIVLRGIEAMARPG